MIKIKGSSWIKGHDSHYKDYREEKRIVKILVEENTIKSA